MSAHLLKEHSTCDLDKYDSTRPSRVGACPILTTSKPLDQFGTVSLQLGMTRTSQNLTRMSLTTMYIVYINHFLLFFCLNPDEGLRSRKVIVTIGSYR